MSSTRTEDTALIASIHALLPEIAERASEIERDRTVPADLLGKLTATGCFRMLLPREFGGLEVDLVEYMNVVEALAEVDGSVAWTVMIGASFPMFWSRYPAELQRRIFADGPDVMARGAFSPRGTGAVAEGGFLVDGRWPLASGCFDYDWMFVTFIVMEGDRPRLAPNGLPEMRVGFLPREDIEIVPTWDALGLRATKSDDVAIRQQFVPEERTIAATGGEVIFGQADDGPTLSRISIFHLAGWHSAVMVGLTRSILRDAAAASHQRRPVMDPSVVMADDPNFRERIGELNIRLDAARTLQWTEAARVWELAAAGQPRTRTDRVRHRSVVAYVHRECLSVADEAFRLAGTSVLYSGSEMQRRWRDLHSAGQHFVASTEAYRYFGGLLCGADPESFPGL
jgi:alkylation response protein AidB-like acyl-CoA dehydrogenase